MYKTRRPVYLSDFVSYALERYEEERKTPEDIKSYSADIQDSSMNRFELLAELLLEGDIEYEEIKDNVLYKKLREDKTLINDLTPSDNHLYEKRKYRLEESVKMGLIKEHEKTSKLDEHKLKTFAYLEKKKKEKIIISDANTIEKPKLLTNQVDPVTSGELFFLRTKYFIYDIDLTRSLYAGTYHIIEKDVKNLPTKQHESEVKEKIKEMRTEFFCGMRYIPYSKLKTIKKTNTQISVEACANLQNIGSYVDDTIPSDMAC